jgi:Ser/Thr protein kinase RdoA (MazF antagonist)
LFDCSARPKRRGLIHADLHFGNAVFRDDGTLSAIDFDDCGYGFYAYDLCVPLLNIEGLVKKHSKLKMATMRESLLKGYTSLKSFDRKDEEMLRLFGVARRISTVGWLNSRSDNPRLAKILPGAVANAVAVIKSLT